MTFDMTTDAKEVLNYFNNMKKDGSTWKIMNNHFMNMAFFLKTNTLKRVIEEFDFRFTENQQNAINKYINIPSNQSDAFRITSAKKRLNFLIQYGLDFAKLNQDQQFLKKALYEYQDRDFMEIILDKGASIYELDKIEKGRLISNLLHHTGKIQKNTIYLLLDNGCRPDCDTLYFIDKNFRKNSVKDYYIIDSSSNNSFIKKLFLDTKQDELLFPNIFSIKHPFQVNMFEYAFYQNKELWNMLLVHHNNLNIDTALERILDKIPDTKSRYDILKHVVSCDIANLNVDYFLNKDTKLTHDEKMTIRNIFITHQKERLFLSLTSEKAINPVSRL